MDWLSCDCMVRHAGLAVIRACEGSCAEARRSRQRCDCWKVTARCGSTPSMLGQGLIDAYEQIGELGNHDRDHRVGCGGQTKRHVPAAEQVQCARRRATTL